MAEPEVPPPNASTRSALQRCNKHGRVYDAATATGCSQCIEEGTTPFAPDPEPPPPPPLPPGQRGLPQSVLLAVLLVLLAVLLAPMLMKPRSGPTAAEAAPAAAAAGAVEGDDDISSGRPRGVRFDPAPHEAQLRAFERLLYETDARGSLSVSGRLQRASRALSDSVSARHAGSAVTRDFVRAVETMMSRLDASSPEAGYSLTDLPGARANWERIRSEYFQDAAWFHAPTGARASP